MTLHSAKVALSLALLALLGLACQDDLVERCEQLETIIEAKKGQLERACTSDDDCFVVALRPDSVVAVSRQPQDAELDAAQAEYHQRCNSAEVEALHAYEALCVAEASASTCQLAYNGEVIDPDLFELPDGAGCDCAEHSDCGRLELCQAGCTCEPRCEAACGQVDSCDSALFLELGLGGDLATCISACEVNYAEDGVESKVRCMAESNCETLAACF